MDDSEISNLNEFLIFVYNLSITLFHLNNNECYLILVACRIIVASILKLIFIEIHFLWLYGTVTLTFEIKVGDITL